MVALSRHLILENKSKKQIFIYQLTATYMKILLRKILVADQFAAPPRRRTQ
jgi:hypothetical protein